MSAQGRGFHPYAFLASIWAVNVASNAFYIAPAPVFTAMRDSLGITYAQAGALISVYLVAILLFQIPAGYVIDRRDPRGIIALGCFGVLAISVVIYFLPQYDVILALRFLAGIPVAFVFVPSAYLVSRVFSRTPGRAVGVFLSGPPAGVAVGNLFGPLVAANFGWPAVYIAFTLPWLVLVPAFLYFARGTPPQAPGTFTLSDYVAAFRNRELWKVGGVFACSYAAYIFYSSWSPTYLSNLGILSAAVLGVLSAAIPAAGVLSRPTGAYLAETRWARDKRLVPLAAFALLTVTSLGVPYLSAGVAPLLIAGGFLAQFPFSVYYILSAQIMPSRFTGSAYALMNSISLIGGAISPPLAGFLADVTGSFVGAYVMMAATAVLGLVLIAGTRER